MADFQILFSYHFVLTHPSLNRPLFPSWPPACLSPACMLCSSYFQLSSFWWMGIPDFCHLAFALSAWCWFAWKRTLPLPFLWSRWSGRQSPRYHRSRQFRRFGILNPSLEGSAAWCSWWFGELFGFWVALGQFWFVECVLCGELIWTCFWPGTQFDHRWCWQFLSTCFQAWATTRGTLDLLGGSIGSF